MTEKLGADLTSQMKDRLREVGELSAERRAVWHEANLSGVTQQVLADASGVVLQTVYWEIRKQRESLLMDSSV
tara:strand:+ start:181 stop:399 length:219 start_codon:yes stop_codon:yes gene_type:complete